MIARTHVLLNFLRSVLLIGLETPHRRELPLTHHIMLIMPEISSTDMRNQSLVSSVHEGQKAYMGLNSRVRSEIAKIFATHPKFPFSSSPSPFFFHLLFLSLSVHSR